MNLLRTKAASGVCYYKLVESKRIEGKQHPQQELIAYLGRYDQAAARIKKLKLSAEAKQALLTKLARLEGLLDAGDVPLSAHDYSCIVIDPPWYYKLRKDDSTHRNRITYTPMLLADILQLPIPALSAYTGCVLWLWTTNNHMPDACQCLEHWGYDLKTILTWEKISKDGSTRFGTGHWLRNATEHCLLAVKGAVKSYLFQRTLTNQSTVLRAPRREHSRKPDAFYELVEHFCPGTKLEMFARQVRPGWDHWGDEVDKFDGANCH